MPDSQPKFVDSFVGKVVIAGISAIFGVIGTWIFYDPPPPPRPQAVIVPSMLTAPGNTRIEFSAESSSMTDALPSTYKWRVGGYSFEESTSAKCNANELTLACYFFFPGTYAVSIELIDANGQSSIATSSVTVSLPNGYLGLVLSRSDMNAFNAVLYDIDWEQLQAHVLQPIVLINPETQKLVYAAFATQPNDVPDPPPWRNAAQGMKISLPGLPASVRSKFELEFAEIGLTPVTYPMGEVYLAMTRGAIDAGFVGLDSPEDLRSFLNAKTVQ